MNDDEKLLGPVCFIKTPDTLKIILYSIIPTMCNPITRTSVVPWDQPLSFAHVHHLKCVFHSLPLHKEIIGNGMNSISKSLTILTSGQLLVVFTFAHIFWRYFVFCR